MKKKRRKKVRKREIEARRGRVMVGAALTLSVFYLALLFFFALAGGRWGDEFSSTHIVASAITGTLFILATVLAVYSFLGNTVARPLFLVLNLSGILFGLFWVGVHLAEGRRTDWLWFDIAGVGTALFVCWALFSSREGKVFLEEQELFVYRK